MAVSVKGFAAHREGVERLLDSYRAIPRDANVRLAKKTSNLFRARAKSTAPGLDVSGLTGVIAIDPGARTADVQGMCTYEDLVDATLPHGLMPFVVPQLKTITLGGAVTGMGIESSSFRLGLPHESLLEVDVLTGAGEVVTATAVNEHADLFRAFPNSYGTLGYSTRLKIELAPVQPYVAVRHVRFDDLAELQRTLGTIVDDREFDGERVDFLDGVVFGRTEGYLTLGTFTDAPGPVSDYTDMDIYYQSIRTKTHDRLTIRDYIWRWDTDWFWCSRAFGAQNPKIRRLWPKRYRRSSFYWKLVALDHRYHIGDKLEKRKGNPPQERVVQDIEVPLEHTAGFLDWFLDNIPIEPVWLCPLRLRDGQPVAGAVDPDRPWTLYPLRPNRTYVNIGFWSAVPGDPSRPGRANRAIEAKVHELNGHKSLYSDAFYTKDEFDALYGGDVYPVLKKTYDPDSRLLDLYAKAVQRK